MASGVQVTGLHPMTASLLETGMYSDLTIKCGNRSWRVHKVIVCLQSKPLAAAMNGEFLEAKTGIIDLSEHHPNTVNYMVKFLYTGDYAIEKLSPELSAVPSVKTEHGSDAGSVNESKEEEESVDEEVPQQTPPETPANASRPNLFSFPGGSLFGSATPTVSVDSKKASTIPLFGMTPPLTTSLFGTTKASNLFSGTEKPRTDATSSSKTNTHQPHLSDILTHTAIYLFAEEKDIPGLKACATKKYEQVLPQAWNSPDFCLSLKQIYEGTPEDDRMLWDVAITYAGANAKALMDRGEFVALLKENGELGYELWKAYFRLASLPAPPVLLKPTGCPDHGVEHARYVVKGRRTTYWCESCRKGF